MEDAVRDMKGFATHPNEHLDEFAAELAMTLYGHRMGYRFANAQVVYLRDRKSATEAEVLANGYVPLGTAGGEFDEHGKTFLTEDGRPRKECTFSLVARKLGIDEELGWANLVVRVRHADRTDDVLPNELSTLIKGWHLLHPHAVVRRRVMKILSDIVRYDRGDGLAGTQRPTFTNKDIIDELWGELSEEFSPETMKMPAVQKFIRLALDRDKMPTSRMRYLEIFRVFRIMQEMYSNEMGQHSMVKYEAKAIMRDSILLAIDYQTAYDAHVPNVREFTLRGTDITVKVDYQQTDNPFFARVARAKKAGIVIIRSGKGNVGIFVNKKLHPHLDMSGVVAALRKADLAKRGGAMPGNLTNFAYWSAEQVEEAPWWYYLRAGQMALNGSNQSSPGVGPTVLTNDEIYGIIKRWARIRRAPSGKRRNHHGRGAQAA
jgi:hypothetical protein